MAYRQDMSFYDGFGRLEETVQMYVVPANSNIVSYQGYDKMGRPSHTWLPVVAPMTYGFFVPLETVRSEVPRTYDDVEPCSLTIYDGSPLNRTFEQYGPGQAWHENHKRVRTSYLVNVAGNDTLNCVLYQSGSFLPATDTIVTIANAGNYVTAQLNVVRMEDEDGNVSFEFKDKMGRTLLNRALNSMNGKRELFDTYHIYDEFENKVAVLPPEASDRMKSVGTWTNANSAALRDYAYLYLYDGGSRLIGKRQPGTDWTYYIYDDADRLVFTQDGNLRRKGKWLYALPDPFGRECVTGICANDLNPFDATSFPSVVKVSREGSATSAPIGHGYYLDGVTLASPVFLNVKYYDTYPSFGKGELPDGFSHYFDWSAAIYDGFGRQYGGFSYAFHGQLTSEKTARISVAEADSVTGYDYTFTYYDYRHRPTQIHESNPRGSSATYFAYNFVGEPTKMKRVHFANNKPTVTELYTYTYDAYMRPLSTTHQLDSLPPVVIVDNVYDILGRLKSNKRNGNANLRTDYTYNIRSWIKNITGPLFSQTLYYNDARPDGSNNPHYNGNISAMDWQVTHTGDNKRRGYNFTYDNLSRLTAADYREAGTSSEKFSAAYSYDMHGNILSLQRHGNKGPAAYDLVDNVTFTYVGNQLVKATDTGEAANNSFSHDFMDGADIDVEYAYDANGNMTMNANNGIYSIAYNLLNLPEKITFAEPGVFNEYVYSADGTKLSVLHKKASSEERTDYVGNMIYKNDSLDMILVDGGYIKNGQYHFYLQDHLGSNRVVADANGNIIQANHYYPYGAPFAESYSSDIQKYKYIGKEYDTDNGLDWYDVEARMMDGLRFTTMDPLAEKY
ncbi:MAG: DUF6443 domain-containing protein, partial [Mediterranea sp.]|nr:DUF6443 domain-containing protein [Mediterranea sp.]